MAQKRPNKCPDLPSTEKDETMGKFIDDEGETFFDDDDDDNINMNIHDSHEDIHDDVNENESVRNNASEEFNGANGPAT